MKKKSILAMLLACSFAFGTAAMTACNVKGDSENQHQSEEQPVAVTGVSLDTNAVSLKIGNKQRLVATVSPSNATNKSVTWSSDKPAVASVDNGEVTAKAVGTAIITVTTVNGNKTDVCTVTVSANDPQTVKVTGVRLNKTSATLTVGGSLTLTEEVQPATATNKNVRWSSDKTSVATVVDGVVTAKSAGEAKITVTTEDGSFTAQCTVTVQSNTPLTTPVSGVSVNPTSATLKPGQQVTLSETVSPANASNKAVTWLSGNTGVATVSDSGVVTAVKAGSATITVKTVDGNYTATCSITVKAEITEPVVKGEITYSYAGNECAAFEWADSNPAQAKVEYKLSSASGYTRVDSQLVRAAASSGVARVDVVGLKGGAVYDFKITPSSGEAMTVTNMTVHSYDREGYAHFKNSSGVGAYNNDGTLKSNARVIYLTEQNKNDVDGNGNSIAQFLKNSSGNSNPIVVRVLGTVGSATWDLKDYGDKYGKTSNNKTPLSASLVSSLTPRIDGGSGSLATEGTVTYYQDTTSYNYESGDQTLDGIYNNLNLHPTRTDGLYDTNECAAINGLNSYMKLKSGEYDSCWNDCSVSKVKNVTVEGIGEDAEIFQWGFTFKNSSSIEVRNLHFDDNTEDACSFEGSETGVSALDSFKSGNIWLHHNTFDEGKNYWDVCPEQDKGDGDGSTDFKGLKNITIAFNHYVATHKTGLIGGADDVSTANVTFHHNHYEGCNQRMPLGRQANMHMYNNYYNASTLYSISLRGGAYAFIENCVFTEAKSTNYPIEIKTSSSGKSAAKIVNCDISKTKAEANNALGSSYLYIGDDRNATVDTTDQRFAKNFDTNSSTFYYDAAAKRTDVDNMLETADVKTVVPQVAGVQKRGGNVTLDDVGNNAIAGTGSTSGGGSETPDPDPTPSGETKTITVIDNFKAANGATTYTFDPSSGTSQYFDSTKLYLYTTASDKNFNCTSTYIKIQSANKIKFTTTSQIPAGAKLVLTMDSTNEAVAVKVNDNNVDVVNGKVTIDLASGTTYILGRVASETRIASISIVIPA